MTTARARLLGRLAGGFAVVVNLILPASEALGYWPHRDPVYQLLGALMIGLTSAALGYQVGFARGLGLGLGFAKRWRGEQHLN